jgi:hypothetical protein
VVIGSVVGDVRRVVVSAAVVQVPSGVVAARPRSRGRLTASARWWTGWRRDCSCSVPARRRRCRADHRSLPALRAFLDGQTAFRSGRYAVALRRYEQALDRDSTFALAGLQLARTADRAYAAQQRARGWRRLARPRRARRAGTRAAAGAGGAALSAPSAAEEQIAPGSASSISRRTNAASWYELALRLFRDGPTARLHAPGAPTPRCAVRWSSTPATRRRASCWRSRGSCSRCWRCRLGRARGGRARHGAAADALPAVARGGGARRRGDAAPLRDSMALLGPANLRSIAQAAQLDAVALDDAHRAVRQLRARALRPEERVDATLAEHALAVNEGRLREARAVAERLAELQPGARAHLRLRVLDALYGDGDPAAADGAAELLRRSAAESPSPEPARRAVQLARRLRAGAVQLARGDTAAARPVGAGAARRATGRAVGVVPAATPPAACAARWDAASAVAERRADAAALVARVDSLALTPAPRRRADLRAGAAGAGLHARLGDARAAYEAVRRRAYMAGWTPYQATALREEARYAAEAGLPEPARAALAQFVALRADPDDALQAQTDEARRTLAAPVQVPPP